MKFTLFLSFILNPILYSFLFPVRFSSWIWTCCGVLCSNGDTLLHWGKYWEQSQLYKLSQPKFIKYFATTKFPQTESTSFRSIVRFQMVFATGEWSERRDAYVEQYAEWILYNDRTIWKTQFRNLEDCKKKSFLSMIVITVNAYFTISVDPKSV